jgi:predicted deacetylase
MTAKAWSVSIHDVAPATWPECLRLLELLAPWSIRVTLLVVPDFHGRGRSDHDPSFIAALQRRVSGGDEVVLHGFTHRDDAPAPRTLRDWWRRRVITDSEGEMAALGQAEAAARIASGIALLRSAGLPPAGFIAPAWLIGRGARAALARSGLGYTSTRDELVALPGWTTVTAPSLVYSTRSRLRRLVSRVWNARRLRLFAGTPLVRVALHPADARHPAVLGHWTSVLSALAADRSPVLESRWLHQRLAA